MEIGAFLTELKERLAAEGGFAEQSASSGPRPRVFISYASEDGELADRTFAPCKKRTSSPGWTPTR